MLSYFLLFRGYYLISNMHLQSAFRIAWKRFTNFSPLVFLVKQVVPFDTIAADSFLRVYPVLRPQREGYRWSPFLISNNRKHVCMFRDFFFFFRFLHDSSVLNRHSDQVLNIKYEDFIFWMCKRKWIRRNGLTLDCNWLGKKVKIIFVSCKNFWLWENEN